MIIVTTNSIEGSKITECLGYVKGSTVRAKHIGRDMMAGFKTIVGGEIKGYTEMLNEARTVAVDRMEQDATNLGANAIVCFRLQTSAVMCGASEIIAYGTAVKIEK